MTTETDTRVLRGAVRAAVLTEGARLGVTAATADDIGRRLIDEFRPELTDIGTVRIASGEAIPDALAHIAAEAPHLFASIRPEDGAQDKVAKRARLAAMPASARLEAANGDDGVSARRGFWGRPQ